MGSKHRVGKARRQWETTVAPAKRAERAAQAFTVGSRAFPGLRSSPAAQTAQRIIDLWNKHNRTVYSVDPDLQREVVRTGLPEGDIPGDIFVRLPHRTPMFTLEDPVVVPEPETNIDVHYDMFAVTSTHGNVIDQRTGKFVPVTQPLLRFVWFGTTQTEPKEFAFTTSSIHLSNTVNLNEALSDIIADIPAEAGDAAIVSREIRGGNWTETNTLLFPVATMLTVYACSQEPDLRHVEPPEELVRRHNKQTKRSVVPTTDLYQLGYRVGTAIRTAHKPVTVTTENATRSSSERIITPHIRRAHWHHYWTGPRKEPTKRKLVVRWIPPTTINANQGRIPSTVHPLRERHRDTNT